MTDLILSVIISIAIILIARELVIFANVLAIKHELNKRKKK